MCFKRMADQGGAATFKDSKHQISPPTVRFARPSLAYLSSTLMPSSDDGPDSRAPGNCVQGSVDTVTGVLETFFGSFRPASYGQFRSL